MTGGVNDLVLNPVTLRPAIVYYDKNAPVSGTTAIGALKYAYLDAYGSWNIEVVDANYGTQVCGTAGAYCVGAPNAAGGSTANIVKLAFTSTGLPSIAYVYGASAATAGAYKQIRLAERSSAGAWSVSVAFSSSTAAGATNVNTTATVDPLKAVTLNFDSSNRPHITFNLYAQTITSSAIYYLSDRALEPGQIHR